VFGNAGQSVCSVTARWLEPQRDCRRKNESHVRDSFGVWPILQLAVMQGEFKPVDASNNTGYADRHCAQSAHRQGLPCVADNPAPGSFGFPSDAVDSTNSAPLGRHGVRMCLHRAIIDFMRW